MPVPVAMRGSLPMRSSSNSHSAGHPQITQITQILNSCLRLCTKSQIPHALAAWSLSFALGGSFGVTVRYHLLQQRGVSIFRY